MTSKPQLRATMRALRKQLADALPDASQQVADFAKELPQASMVALYAAVGPELDPEPLARALQQTGRRLCLPVVTERGQALIFRCWTPGDPLETDLGGCPAPLPLADEVIPDLILTPLLAFDRNGGRLGQGGGYYDRTFAALPAVPRIGLAYSGQAVEALPMDAHDQWLDGVLTEVGYIATRKVT
ncbi:5-formyltetrahydrofolate cyclo-ligase [Brevundimonas variabilis]|uniref:5-formyltetrahydrofolate cyclo-ligase n=1 Tax=Brevundimonas variabilis TaxID=74312 RepID=A0A7W9CK23_9CAUL|nr:5-formyltetrahydrofolate cyclo-ligase [Brevundimonas variabilis]MBB5746914.1 5-formyltetrahydrofolate cyclo-ligase [Brevundimonas variabilis]